MILDKTMYRQVLGHFATGVAVLTTCSGARPVGLTINSFCSVSLDPPLVLVCIDRRSTTLRSLRKSGLFVVNILTDQQDDISRGFAMPSKDRYEHFCSVSYWQTTAGSPVIDGVLAFIEARIVSEYPGGDHVILLGQVQALGLDNQVLFDEQGNAYDAEEAATCRDNGLRGLAASPLLYYRGHYRAFEYRQPTVSEYDKERLHTIKVR